MNAPPPAPTAITPESAVRLPRPVSAAPSNDDILDLSQNQSKKPSSSGPKFFGRDVVESSFATTGSVIARKTAGAGLLTTGTGSIVGVAAADGIKGAIAQGKKSRNVSENDGYKFGDFTRGAISGLRQASKRGTELRGGTQYVPGDLTRGSSKGVKEYAGKNKAKLASTGGASVGSFIGLAVAGPLGFLAGSYLGAKTGQSCGTSRVDEEDDVSISSERGSENHGFQEAHHR